jgi:aspartyl-tRNA(Asn)/glutamyl-tRNA(Gln) amidotransferase subunit A
MQEIIILGLPAVSVPVEVNSQGLPLGLQLIGQSMKEDVLLNVAMCLENKKFVDLEPPLLKNK